MTKPPGRMMRQIVEQIRKTPDPTLIPTGLQVLDKQLGGMMAGDVWVVAGPTGKGKTSFAIDILRRQAEQQKVVGLFSLELSGEDIRNRLVQAYTGVSEVLIRTRMLNDSQKSEIEEVDRIIEQLNIIVDDPPTLNGEELRFKVKQWSTLGVEMVAVDYLQIMSGSSDSRYYEITKAIQEIKASARENHIPILVLAQFNRSSSFRDSGELRLSDLSDSSEIEKTADAVIFIQHGDPPYCDLQIKKHRQGGRLGTVTVGFDAEHSRYYDLEDDDNG